MMYWFFENSIVIALAIFCSLLLCTELGRSIGRRRLAQDPEAVPSGTGTIDGAVFALFGLILAFTFSGAAARFDLRRAMIVEEANSVGTAFLRVDLAPESAQSALRDAIRHYAEARVATYADIGQEGAFAASSAKTAAMQADIWKLAVDATHLPGATPTLNTTLIPALNQMFDIAATRSASLVMHPPTAIFGMLFALALICATLAGHGMMQSKRRNWLHITGFAAIMTITLYTIIDLEFPRLGVFRVNGMDHLITDAVK